MPDISKHAAVLEDLKNGSIRTLGVSIGPTAISPGQKIPKAETHQNPKLIAPSDLSKDSTYTVICLDLDAPFISWNVMSPIAHLIQTGLKISHEEGEGHELKSSEPSLGPWAGAGPPPGAQPHRYVFYLFEEKDTDSSMTSRRKPRSTWQRVRVDFDALVKDLGLGEMVAANYFVSN